MNRTLRNLSLPLVALLLASCASGGPGSGGESMGDPDVITREEIDDASGARNAYQLVQSVRPQWFVTRGFTNLRQATGAEDIVVYLDNARLGYREELRRVPLGNVRYLRFFDAREATQRWGQGHTHGAILVSTEEPR